MKVVASIFTLGFLGGILVGSCLWAIAYGIKKMREYDE